MNTNPNQPKKEGRIRTDLIDRLMDRNTTDWPREMKIARKLFADLKDLEFWDTFELGYKIKSMGFLLTYQGRNEVDRLYAIFKSGKKQETSSPINQSGAPKQLKEFIK